MSALAAEIGVLRREGERLQALAGMLEDADWSRVTPFKDWTVWDVIAHLHLSDDGALAALQGPEAFRRHVAALLRALQGGDSMAAYTRRHYADRPGAAILTSWRRCFADLLASLGGLEATARLSWFGPDMGARTFVNARYMETWAHGQDILDLLDRDRVYDDDLHAIATLGVKTFAFSFANRGLAVPAIAPQVRLIAPSGAIWEWNAPSATERIEGLASEFCHVVTQGRHLADTRLDVRGATAQQWMAIAQCFAGPPATPPEPGTRGRR